MEDKPGKDVLERLSKYYTAWAQFFADRPQYRQYYQEVVVPYVQTYCRGLVDLSEIRLAPMP